GIRSCRYGCGIAHTAAVRRVSRIYGNGRRNVHVPVVRGIQFSRQQLYVLGAAEHRARSSSLQKLSRRAQAALRLELQATELKARLAHEQLNALKMQLQPHFLFNTLNAIMVLVRQQKASEAEDMLVSLSDLLRCVLEDMDAQEVSLRRELEYLRLYFPTDHPRFRDGWRVEFAADPAVLDAAVPQMGLQPIVENAIR